VKKNVYPDNINNGRRRNKLNNLRVAASIATLFTAGAIIMGGLILSFNSLDVFSVPLLFVIAGLLVTLFFFVRRELKISQYWLIVLALMALGSGVLVSLLPTYLQGLHVHGIIHRSFVSGLLLLAFGLSGVYYSLFYRLSAKPRAFDVARYPIIIFFTITALVAYSLIVIHIVQNGVVQWQWSLFTTAFQSQSHIIETWQNGWPTFSVNPIYRAGILNHIIGTLMLMFLTSVISLPIGVSVGVFIHEYAGAKLGGIINFSTTALRSISGIILAVTAIDLLAVPKLGTLWFSIFHGFGHDVNGMIQYGRSSFLFASAFISLLVIPVIAKSTQEGLNSIPVDVREGSLAMGASKDFTLFHLQLPWSLPNIITGLMLGCAEAAGALTIIFLLSGVGQYGVSPLNETTSLAYLIFDIKFWQSLGDPVSNLKNSQFVVAFVLLIMTVGFTTIALILKRNLSKRYKGV